MKYASRAFVCFLSHSLFNPTRVLCFFKHGTWKMRSLFQVEKRIWPQAQGSTFLRGKTSHLCSITESHEMCTCHFRARVQVPASPARLSQTLSLPTAPLWGQRGCLKKRGLPLANPLNILISSSPVAEKTASKYFKDGFVKVTAEEKKREKEQFPAPHCSCRNKGKLGGLGAWSPESHRHGHGQGTTPPGQTH